MAPSNTAGGRGCAVVALGGGLLILAVAVYGVIEAARRSDHQQVTEGMKFLVVWGLLVAGASWMFWRGGFVAAGVAGSRAADDRPWLRRSDWARGNIRNAGTAVAWKNALGAAVMLYYGYTCGTATFETPDVWLGSYVIFAILIIAGINFLRKAVAAAVAFVSFGTSRLTLITIPGEIGGRIAGTVRVPRGIAPATRITGHLRCVRVTVKRDSDGDRRGTKEEIIRQEQQSFEADRDTGGGVRIPVEFFIPPNAAPTQTIRRDETIVWRIVVEDASASSNYHASFDVPVYDQKPEERPEVTAG